MSPEDSSPEARAVGRESYERDPFSIGE